MMYSYLTISWRNIAIIVTFVVQSNSQNSRDCIEYNIGSIIANKINEKRKLHWAPMLRVNPNLTLEATDIAWQFATKGDVYQHDRSGETIYIAPIDKTSDDLTQGTDFNAVESWYDQKQNYPGDYDAPTRFQYEYFTQLVWKSTKEVGCGACYNEKAIYIVCKYYPQGNVQTKYQSNVIIDLNDTTFMKPNGSDFIVSSPSSLMILILIFLILKF